MALSDGFETTKCKTFFSAGLCALLVLASFLLFFGAAIDGQVNGDGWNSVDVCESLPLQWLKTNPLQGQVYNDEPDHIYFAVVISAKFIVSLDSSTPCPVSSTREGNNKYPVLFYNMTD
jgi:hypothetical protein